MSEQTPSLNAAAPAEREIRPSQLVNLGLFVTRGLAVLVVGAAFLALRTRYPVPWWALPVLVVILAWSPVAAALRVACTSYHLESDRITFKRGVLARRVTSLEIFRIVDVTLEQSLWERIVRIGRLTLHTSDVNQPVILLIGLKAPEPFRKALTEYVQINRRQRGFREYQVDAT